MDFNKTDMLDFNEWSTLYKQAQGEDCGDVSEAKESEIDEIRPNLGRTNEALERIKKLCRVCSSNGLININSKIQRSYMKISNYAKGNSWDVTIAFIIAEVSGEKISEDDLLPQYICEHCLGYLQHAYQMRLKIVSNTSNLKLALEIAKEESVLLEDAQIDQSRITKREVDEWNDDAVEESHFYNQFQGANIQVSSTPMVPKQVDRAIEYKCPSCKKRVMSISSLNDHMEVCGIRVLDTFFSELQSIYSQRLTDKLTTTEYIAHGIKLVYDTNKRLQQIAKKKKIDTNAISDVIPQDYYSPPIPPAIRQQRNYQSPDNGYISGGNAIYTPR